MSGKNCTKDAYGADQHVSAYGSLMYINTSSDIPFSDACTTACTSLETINIIVKTAIEYTHILTYTHDTSKLHTSVDRQEEVSDEQ